MVEDNHFSKKGLNHITKILEFFSICMIVLLIISCIYCLKKSDKNAHNDSSTGEVYIINDEVVENGYIHVDNNESL